MVSKPERRQRLVEIAAWVAQMCLMFGSSPHTAYTVAGLFVEGIDREWSKQGR
jgi:hypothetical protein